MEVAVVAVAQLMEVRTLMVLKLAPNHHLQLIVLDLKPMDRNLVQTLVQTLVLKLTGLGLGLNLMVLMPGPRVDLRAMGLVLKLPMAREVRHLLVQAQTMAHTLLVLKPLMALALALVLVQALKLLDLKVTDLEVRILVLKLKLTVLTLALVLKVMALTLVLVLKVMVLDLKQVADLRRVNKPMVLILMDLKIMVLNLDRKLVLPASQIQDLNLMDQIQDQIQDLIQDLNLMDQIQDLIQDLNLMDQIQDQIQDLIQVLNLMDPIQDLRILQATGLNHLVLKLMAPGVKVLLVVRLAQVRRP